MKKIKSLLDITSFYHVFIIDVFGVLWDGKAFYPSALKVCQELMSLGKKIYILSNATTISSHFKEKHKKNGFIQGEHYTDVITSGDVFQYKLIQENFLDKVAGSATGKYLLIGRPNDKLLASVLDRQTDRVEEASAVYLGALEVKDSLRNERFKKITSFLPIMQKVLDKKLPVICSNPDFFSMIGAEKYVTQGSLAQYYEQHGGQVYWIGKPYLEVYRFTLNKAQAKPEETVMVGDTIRTDILGGKNAELKTVLITKTGITADLIARGHSLDEIEKLEGAIPDYLLERLR